jgi:hypothetical protein
MHKQKLFLSEKKKQTTSFEVFPKNNDLTAA